MGYPQTQILYYPAAGGAGEDITSKVTNWKTSNSIDKKAGTFSITLNNPQGHNTGSIQYGDNIEIKAGYIPSGLTTVFYGILEEENPRALNGTLEYRGIDYAGKLMDSLVQQVYNSGTNIGKLWRWTGAGSSEVTYDGGSISSSVVVQHLIRQFYYKALPGDNIDYVRFIDMGTKGWSTVEAFNDAGSNFFKNFSNKRLNECIEEIKDSKFTGNGDYIFYVDNNKCVHFEPKPNASYDGHEIDDSSDCNDFDLTRSTFNQYTAILVNAGQVSGNTFDTYCAGYNRTAIRQSGWKWGYVDRKGIAKDIDNTYPDYNLGSRLNLVKSGGRIVADEMARNQGLPKWGGKITIKGTNAYTIGSAYDVLFQMTHFGDGEGDFLGSKTMRLTGVEHQFGRNGWLTTLDLKQDYGDIR